MKPFLFITDFDGTATAQDFYLQLLFRYEHEKAATRYPAFLRGELTCFDFLSEVFAEPGLSEQQLLEEIQRIPLDPFFAGTVAAFQQAGADILVLSAGCEYYIRRRLEMAGVQNVRIIATPGDYHDGGIRMRHNPDSRFHSQKYGTDKKAAFARLRPQYQTVAYAGDGGPDFAACAQADIRFARRSLAQLLERDKLPYTPFDNFDQIRQTLLPVLTSADKKDQ